MLFGVKKFFDVHHSQLGNRQFFALSGFVQHHLRVSLDAHGLKPRGGGAGGGAVIFPKIPRRYMLSGKNVFSIMHFAIIEFVNFLLNA